MAGNNGGADSRRPLVDKVRELKSRDYALGIITNNVAEFGDGWRGLVPVDELFDFVVDSSSAGVRKPDPRIFELALAQLDGIEPAEALFLDDYLANVEAAGGQVLPDKEEHDFGRFGWFVDPDGTRVELWEPPASLPEADGE